MKIVVLLLFLVRVFSEDAVHDPDVIVLTDDNFDLIVYPEETMLVEFYAPWCGHCKHLAPEYAKAATALKANDPPVKLGKVDATVQKQLAGRFNLNGYPTLFVFRNGKETAYKGPRQADGIVNYMKKQVGPAAKPLETKEQIDAFVNGEEYAVVGFFGKEISQLQAAFSMLTGKLRDHIKFGKVSDSKLFEAYGLKAGSDHIVAFKKYDEGRVVYEGSTKTQDIESWVDYHSLPLVGEFKQNEAERYSRRNLPIAKLFVPLDLGRTKLKYYVNRIKHGAEQFKNKILVTIANKGDFPKETESYNLKGKDDIGLVIEHQQDKYRMEDKFSPESVIKFFTDFVGGKLRKHMKSEKIPTNDGAVKTVVGLNFDEVVNDPEKDVLIEFYAPWCGHCKSLAPKYDELAEKLKKVDSVVVGKLDATVNDWDRSRFEVSGYPTLYFVPAAKDAKPVKYDGAREVDDMYKFIKKNANKKFK
jgi:protein disulfide isomerase family A protein 3